MRYGVSTSRSRGVGRAERRRGADRGATERFLATWNTRDPEQWAGSLNYPHARPSAAGYRVWPTRQA